VPEKPPSDVSSLYVSNWSLNEPLCQSQSVAYLKALAARGHRSCLITFERAPYAMPASDAVAAKRALDAAGVCWHPIPYHRRRNLAVAAFDTIRGLATAVAAVIRHGARIIHTRTSVPAVIGLVAARLTGRRFLYDADSELSEEYVDGGHWRRGSAMHRLLSRIERTCRRESDAIVVLTERLRERFLDERPGASVTVIPCCVDVVRFRFDSTARENRRRELGAGSTKLLVYVGKIGPRYMIDETIEFAKTVRRHVGDARLLVLSHEDPAAFQAIAERHGFGAWMDVRRASTDEIPGWLSAADAGIALIRPSASERGSSPIKISEYLAAGLPVVTTPAIGDVSAAIERESLGVVIPEQTSDAFSAAAARLETVWLEPSDARARSMKWARTSLDLFGVGASRYARLYDALLMAGPTSAPVQVRGCNE